MKVNFSIRPATKSDLDILPDLESRSDESYRPMARFALMLAMEGLSVEQCQNLDPSSRVWMAHTDQPVGFILTRDVDDLMFVVQLSVIPEMQGSGIGSALIDIALETAKNASKRGVVLSTYSDVPFNGPFYAKRGFVEVSGKNMGPDLLAVAKADEQKWARFSPRIIMGQFFL